MYGDVVTITGHRDYPDRAALYTGLDDLGAKQYYLGGARGVDSDALKYLAETQPSSIRTVVVPDRLINQPAAAREIIEKYATNVIELRNTGPDRFMIRNKYMVDHSSRVKAFYDFRGSGGTYNTIEYAKLTGKQISIQPLIDYNYDNYTKMSKGEFATWTKKMKENNVNLSSIKGLILHMIIKVFKMTVEGFCNMLGYIGCKTLEAMWQRYNFCLRIRICIRCSFSECIENIIRSCQNLLCSDPSLNMITRI
ncbi:hypothetical protein ES705_37177 [subsurface metagenome]